MSRKSIILTIKRSKKVILIKIKNCSIEDIDVNKIFVSEKESYGTKNAIKYFIGYTANNEIKPICIRLPNDWIC